MKKITYLLSIGLMFALLGCGIAAPTVVPKNQPDITMAEFNQIKNGMAYEQVTSIIGGPGEMMVETGTPGDPLYTVKYQFKGEGIINSNAQLTFQSGKLNTKAQMGLK